MTRFLRRNANMSGSHQQPAGCGAGLFPRRCLTGWGLGFRACERRHDIATGDRTGRQAPGWVRCPCLGSKLSSPFFRGMAEEVLIPACRLYLDRYCLDLTPLPVRVEVEVTDDVARYQRRHRPSCYRETPETCSGVRGFISLR